MQSSDLILTVPSDNAGLLDIEKIDKCYKLGYDTAIKNMDEIFILFGKETKGLPEDLLKQYIDKAIRIPMKEGLRSLNLSNSVAIVVYEVLRQNNFNNLQQISNYFE